MRKITDNAIYAFLNDRKFNGSNTLVSINSSGTILKLHGNLIAIKKDGKLWITNAGWFSNTTKERLNGLPNVHIKQIKGLWYLNGNFWDGKLIAIE